MLVRFMLCMIYVKCAFLCIIKKYDCNYLAMITSLEFHILSKSTIILVTLSMMTCISFSLCYDIHVVILCFI